MYDAGQGREMVIIANHTAGQADLPAPIVGFGSQDAPRRAFVRRQRTAV
jgi:hypothetical protein